MDTNHRWPRLVVFVAGIHVRVLHKAVVTNRLTMNTFAQRLVCVQRVHLSQRLDTVRVIDQIVVGVVVGAAHCAQQVYDVGAEKVSSSKVETHIGLCLSLLCTAARSLLVVFLFMVAVRAILLLDTLASRCRRRGLLYGLARHDDIQVTYAKKEKKEGLKSERE